MGYHRAGFDVVGVDIEPQPHYPFEFVQADALTFPLDGFDAIHASPPCQGYSSATSHFGSGHPLLIEEVRSRLLASGVPYVIENVRGAPLPSAVMLCGSVFGLRVWRHRYFESNVPMLVPSCQHKRKEPPINPYRTESRVRDGLRVGSMLAFGAAMGIDWMTTREITEAIPPIYTEWIGQHLLAVA